MSINANWAHTYRPITEDDELKALPHGTVIRDEGGFIYEADYADGDEYPWYLPGIEDPVRFDSIDLPAHVLYAPEEAP